MEESKCPETGKTPAILAMILLGGGHKPVVAKRIILLATLSTALVVPATRTARAQTDYDHLLDGRTIDFDLSLEPIMRAKLTLSQGNDKIDPAIRSLVG
ncbi:MAG: hypothetical protein OXC19_04915 [Bryobacterales bacterium]|nr:hypothetical protein [Bryobacterales bacterium]